MKDFCSSIDSSLAEPGQRSALMTLASAELEPVFWPPELLGKPSAWWSHVPFSFWAMSALQPRLFVELGSHHGVSYAGFCEAAMRSRTACRCYAVDTWHGDAHTDSYDESVYWGLKEFHDRRYASFSELLRCSFDEALIHFADGSIDLLHIDGLHTYEAVKHDFESWRPKLSDRGVVLFHDTNVRQKDFGVHRFFAELAKHYPSFEFLHGHGLGIVLIGGLAPNPAKELCALSDPIMIGSLRERFSRLGALWETTTREALGAATALYEQATRVKGFERSLEEERENSARVLAELNAARRVTERAAARIDQQRKTIDELNTLIASVPADAEQTIERLQAQIEHLQGNFAAKVPDQRRKEVPQYTLKHYLIYSIIKFLSMVISPVSQRTSERFARSAKKRSPWSQPVTLSNPPPRLREVVDPAKRQILYLSGEHQTPGHTYRVAQYIEAAAANGVVSNWLTVADLPSRFGELLSYDALVIWRTPWNENIEHAVTLMQEAGRLVIFDCDDLMTEPDLAVTKIIDGIRTQNLTEDGVREHYNRMRASMLAADICFASTQELAFHMRWCSKVTHVLPNGFSQSTHDVSRQAARSWRHHRDGLIRIGYAGGSRTHQRDLGLAIEAVARVLREHSECRLVLFRSPDGALPIIDVNEFPALDGLADQIEWRSLQPLQDLPLEMARFDINLAPLEIGNPFCEAKSELKFFEAALVDVPTVASPTGPFRRAIAHGKTGFLATSGDDWYVYLTKLIENPELRARLAHNAYHASLANFGPRQRALQFGRVLDQLRGGPRSARAFALGALISARPARSPTVLGYEVAFEKDKGEAAKVSVIIPLYNYASLVTEALDSVRRQTLSTLDLVIVDDSSTDSSLTVALEWARAHFARFNRIAVIRNIANYGLGLCRNIGFDVADTPYVLPLDADNRLLSACCESLLRAIEKSGVAYVYPTIQHFGDSSELLSNHPYDPQRFVAGNYVDAMALIAKEAWAMVGGYVHVHHGWEDYDLWSRMAETGLSGELFSEVLAEYRVHAQSMLKTETTVDANFRRLNADFATRHPWVSLVDTQALRQPLRSDPRLTDQSAQARLDRILATLRCPASGQKLAYSSDGSALVSVDGLNRWPIIEGRPVLSAKLGSPEIKLAHHVSNEVPDNALDIIRECKGLVLNLSAGGSQEKFEHVIEVEYAIFRHTDVVADAHQLPFDDDCFEAVIVMNAFEHYSDPPQVAAELYRVLKPGGRIHIRTAFLQPLHERPWHFYNATRYGVAEWFKAFDTEILHVSPNFCPNHTLSWIASEAETALRSDLSAEAAEAFRSGSIGSLVDLWTDPSLRVERLWTDFEGLSQEKQEGIAAGFELIGRKPLRSSNFR